MGTRVKFAPWRKVGRVFVVRPPDWPKHCEISFSEKEDMIEWARCCGYMLKDVNPAREVRGYGTPYAAKRG